MKIFIIFVMLFNINQHDKKSFDNLKYTSLAVAISPFGDVEQPSACAGFFVMENYNLFNQPPLPTVKNKVTQELVKSLFEYKEGVLYWKVKSSSNITIGDIAGTLSRDKKDDRIKIMINKKQLKRSRLVFLYHNGWLPKIIDHRDRDTLNDRIENLRAATQAQNNMNMTCSRGLSSVYKGAYPTKNKERWTSFIKINGKRKYLGTFKTEQEAAIAYNMAAKELFGEFANLNVIEL